MHLISMELVVIYIYIFWVIKRSWEEGSRTVVAQNHVHATALPSHPLVDFALAQMKLP